MKEGFKGAGRREEDMVCPDLTDKLEAEDVIVYFDGDTDRRKTR